MLFYLCIESSSCEYSWMLNVDIFMECGGGSGSHTIVYLAGTFYLIDHFA